MKPNRVFVYLANKYVVSVHGAPVIMWGREMTCSIAVNSSLADWMNT
jgi:hypothetical protein